MGGGCCVGVAQVWDDGPVGAGGLRERLNCSYTLCSPPRSRLPLGRAGRGSAPRSVVAFSTSRQSRYRLSEAQAVTVASASPPQMPRRPWLPTTTPRRAGGGGGDGAGKEGAQVGGDADSQRLVTGHHCQGAVEVGPSHSSAKSFTTSSRALMQAIHGTAWFEIDCIRPPVTPSPPRNPQERGASSGIDGNRENTWTLRQESIAASKRTQEANYKLSLRCLRCFYKGQCGRMYPEKQQSIIKSLYNYISDS